MIKCTALLFIHTNFAKFCDITYYTQFNFNRWIPHGRNHWASFLVFRYVTGSIQSTYSLEKTALIKRFHGILKCHLLM